VQIERFMDNREETVEMARLHRLTGPNWLRSRAPGVGSFYRLRDAVEQGWPAPLSATALLDRESC
jgi:hypothetical protein